MILWGFAVLNRPSGYHIDTHPRWILVSLFTQMLALSLSEICSKYPTSAGAYYWCYRLAPPRYKLIFSWINGWLNLVGNWTITLSVTFGIPAVVSQENHIYSLCAFCKERRN